MADVRTSPAAKKEADLKASMVSIDILVVINTDYIKDYCVKNNIPPHLDPNNPYGIDHSSEFMICTGAREIFSGQGTGDLYFRANPGDSVSFRGTSIYANSDDAVILYGIKKYEGDDVFNTFVVNKVRRNGAVIPDTSTPNGIPALHTQISFNSYTSTVSGSGEEGFKVQFGLYELDANGQIQNLYGYFDWDPRIKVS
ncbi:Inclusion body protein [Chitinophaga sp. CF118]|uniref:inclusion body family protein n=1 Tax=Chitinophaga sp. CF118 TaxID=1884367 RepID=UPI0008DEAC7E|nr:inclusion body family protein [Chitinophaga sp. CF118]SFD88537.1 Inclusion body protein [Chitinophaga sp. CF118]